MSGQAGRYDCFTPDLGELAFLADEQAPHPFYTRGFILHENNRAEDLIERAYRHDNAAQNLLVKGGTDRVVERGRGWTASMHPRPRPWRPSAAPATPSPACSRPCARPGMISCRRPRWRPAPTGCAALSPRPTPASPVSELITAIPRALADLGLPAISA